MHWAVLVTDRDFSEVLSLLHRARLGTEAGHEALGTLYQLRRGEENENVNQNIPNFGTSHLRDEWQIKSIRYIGLTTFTDENIEAKSTPQGGRN